MRRIEHLQRFYNCLEKLEKNIGGFRTLSTCSGRMAWPERGVYFFMEPGEIRSDSGQGLRIVRVGTHALKPGAESTLWRRLAQHRGTTAGRGNHRTSIFRWIVGNALLSQQALVCPSWDDARVQPGEPDEASESDVEQTVSSVIGRMPFLWLAVPDEPGPDSLRGYIERNAIALLSHRREDSLDPPRPIGWGTIATGGKCARRAFGTPNIRTKSTIRLFWTPWSTLRRNPPPLLISDHCRLVPVDFDRMPNLQRSITHTTSNSGIL